MLMITDIILFPTLVDHSAISAALFAVIMVAPVNVLKSRLAQLEECKRLNDQAGVNNMLAQWKSIALDGSRNIIVTRQTTHFWQWPTRLRSLLHRSKASPHLSVNLKE
ncbi:hypothetical protein HDV62DRAFT_363650 [Trichoderma sp. SZMC 28011]